MNKAILNKVVQLSVALKEVREEVAKHQERAKQLEEEIAALMGADSATDQGASGREQRGGGSGRGTVAAVVIQVLDAEPDSTLTVDDVRTRIATLGHDPSVESLRTTLARLAREGKIQNVRRGLYQSAHGTKKIAEDANGAVPHMEGGMIQ